MARQRGLMKTRKVMEEKTGKAKFAIIESDTRSLKRKIYKASKAPMKRKRVKARKTIRHKKSQIIVHKIGLVEPELHLLRTGYLPPETNLGTDFKGKNRVIISK